MTTEKRDPEEIHKRRLRILINNVKRGAINNIQSHPMLRLGPARIKYSPSFSYDVKGESLKRYEDILDRIPRQTLAIIRRAWRVWGPGVLILIRERKGQIEEYAREYPEDASGDVDGNR